MFGPRRLTLAVFALCACAWGTWAPTVSAAEKCRFQFIPARQGDISCQELDFLIDLKLTVHQGKSQLYHSSKSVERAQTRWTQVLEMNGDVVTSVGVRFDRASETQVSENKPGESRSEAVLGRTYRVTRSGEKLLITDLENRTPTTEETTYLAQALDAVGRPNSLGRFLHGRELTAGTAIDVPPEVATEIFGFRDAVGEVAELKLTLGAVHVTTAGTYAILNAELTAHSPEEPKMAIRMEGQMQLDVNTCRLVGFVWEGPVTLSEQRGDGGQSMALTGTGTLAVEMRSKRAATWPSPPSNNDYASSPSSSRK